MNSSTSNVRRAGCCASTSIASPGRAYDTGAGDAVTVDDCERVTRQLQYALEVDGVDYARLEVSSPGLDRPLRKPADWDRFAGSEVDLTLRAPFQGRKHWRGVLQPRDAGWRLVLPPPTARRRRAPARRSTSTLTRCARRGSCRSWISRAAARGRPHRSSGERLTKGDRKQ